MSIRMKLLFMSISLVLITTISISAASYILTKQNARRESRQRLSIAFEIVQEDLRDRTNTSIERMNDFLQENISLLTALYAYSVDSSEHGTIAFLFDHFPEISQDIKRFGRVLTVDRLMLYGINNRLLISYQSVKGGEEEVLGSYFVSAEEGGTYLPMEDPSILAEVTFRKNNASLGITSKPFPKVEFPAGIHAEYRDSVPKTVEAGLFQKDGQLGLRIIAPVYRRDERIGFLVGESVYTQQTIEKYASVSKAEINMFAGEELAIGTLPEQTHLESNALQRLPFCGKAEVSEQHMESLSVTFAKQDYYQGRCAFRDTAGDIVGAITVSLSKDAERQNIQKAFTAILLIAGLVIVLVIAFSMLVSHLAVSTVYTLVNVVDAAAEGDLREMAVISTRDEIGRLAHSLNQMIKQLRGITAQVQTSSRSVNLGADAILREMGELMQHMEQQSSSVDNTSAAIAQINEFIEVLAQSMDDLFAAADQILTSTQQTQANIEEVTFSTESLTKNLHDISDSITQTNQATKQVATNAEHLETQAEQAENDIRHIEESLQSVSENAGLSQKLAQDTMDAATQGQQAVEVSMQGMNELKAVVSDAAHIMQEVDSWGEQVSSILDIVDEITEQTALLSLNASIISAQAGVHGRGFAVVANEIKELAERTKTSTQKIGGLVHELRQKTEEGVERIDQGLSKADHEVRLAGEAREALVTILERATRSSKRAADTAKIVRQTADNGGNIKRSMTEITTMVANIRKALQHEEQHIGQVAVAVENISGMANQVNRATLEQKSASIQISQSMGDTVIKFKDMAELSGELKQNSAQIVNAIQTIESVTDQILGQTGKISDDTVKTLIEQSETLQNIVGIFKTS